MSQEDLDLLMAGGVPQKEMLNGDKGRFKAMVIAAKTAFAHKGIILPNEMDHLKKLGIDLRGELSEIIFLAAEVQGLNQIMPNYLNQGVKVDEFLQKIGPFKNTVYGEFKADAVRKDNLQTV